jgi:hypothetical protein
VITVPFYDFVYRREQTFAPKIWSSRGDVSLPLSSIELDDGKTTPLERRFNPYDFNGG